MNLTALYDTYYEKSGNQHNNMNELVAAGLLYIIRRYIVHWSNNFVMTISCNREHTCVFYNDLFERLLAAWGELPVQIVNVQKSHTGQVQGKRYNNIIFTDSYESFVEADLNLYTSQNDYNEFYYIFLQHWDAFLQDEMLKIFEYCWQHYLINCSVQIQNSKGELLIYTYFPFTEKYCGKVQVTLINKLNTSSQEGEPLFPWKLRNFYGCPLKVATWNAPPYLMLSNSSKGGWEVTNGFEGLLLLELSRKLNFTLDIKVPDNDEQRGIIMANGTLTGAMKMLQEHIVDLSIGSFRQSVDRSAIATPTSNYYQSTISLVALEDVYRLSSLQTLLFPFQRDTWLLLIALDIFAMCIIAILKKIYTNNLSRDIGKGIMDIFLMLVGMPAIYQSKRMAARVFDTFWMMYALIIRTIYQALLFHVVRTHITIDSPHSMEELAAREYTMVMNKQAGDYIASVYPLTNINMMRLNSSSEFIAMEFLESLPLTKAAKYVAAMPTDFISYYIQSEKKTAIYRVFPYQVIPFKVCIYLPKHSFLIEQFTEILMWFKGCGLINAWSHRVLDHRYGSQSVLEEDHLFGIAQLKMLFVLLMVGHCVAALVFFIELLYTKYRIVKKP